MVAILGGYQSDFARNITREGLGDIAARQDLAAASDVRPCVEGIAAAEKIRDRLKQMQGGTIACGFAGNPNEPNAMRGGPIGSDFLLTDGFLLVVVGLDRKSRRGPG